MEMPTTAMVLAAGFGKRMRPLTDNIPKPLVEVGDRALIDHVLDRFVAAGIMKVVINVSYKGEMIMNHLKERSDIEILFSHEDTPLETGGGIKKALPLIGEQPFFICNSDSLWFDNQLRVAAFQLLYNTWNENIDSVLLLIPRLQAVGYEGRGDFYLNYAPQPPPQAVDINEAGTIRFRLECEETAPYVFSGIQLMHPRLLWNYPDESFPLAKVFRERLNDEGYIKNIAGIEYVGEWIHVGTPELIETAERKINDTNSHSLKY